MAKTIKDETPKLKKYLKGITPTAFNQLTLKAFFDDLKKNHTIPSELNYENFIIILTKMGKIDPTKIKYVGTANSEREEFTRFAFNSPSAFSIGLSLRSKSYLSHNSALYIHGLIDKLPEEMCINKEQSKKKDLNDSTLTQESIRRAYKNKARQSQYIWKWKTHKFIFLNGKNTGDYGVIDLKLDNGEKIRTTDLERTLIDIVVRPIYSGGVKQLIEIYSRAKEQASANKIIRTLQKLNHKYPYHQSIGFLMNHAGYDKKEIDKLRDMGIQYDFYLDYHMKDMEYDSDWKLYYPKGLLG
ncbi:MAG: hypothetical protein WD000_01905 [Thermodesulfobacteriota bacterium]